MLPPPAFLTTEARLAPKGAAIDNAFHHTRCCCAFSSFQIFCVECVGAKPAARLEVLLCAVRILQTHLGSALRSAAAISISWPRGNHYAPRLHMWMYQLLRGSALFWLTPPIFPGPPHLTPFPSRAHALPIQPWIRPVTMEAGIGLGTTLNHTIHAPALTSGFSW